jgi:hypothetical protein
MWDILTYLPSELALALRKGRENYLFAFPWKEPCAYGEWDIEKPEAINIGKNELFLALVIRAKVDAFARATRMAKANLNGKVPRNLQELQINALKFAFKRFQQKRVQAPEFLDDLRCCALLDSIPDAFWGALSQQVNAERLEKLQRSMKILERFHLDPEQWLEPSVTYISRCLWAQDAFEIIALASSQIAICYPNASTKPLFVELGQRAQGLMKAREIEQTMGSMKPWQRNAPSMKKSIRVGPRSAQGRRDKKDENKEEGGN